MSSPHELPEITYVLRENGFIITFSSKGAQVSWDPSHAYGGNGGYLTRSMLWRMARTLERAGYRIPVEQECWEPFHSEGEDALRVCGLPEGHEPPCSAGVEQERA